MTDDVRPILQARYPDVPEDDYDQLQAYWDALAALGERLDPLASGPADIATTYRAGGVTHD